MSERKVSQFMLFKFESSIIFVSSFYFMCCSKICFVQCWFKNGLQHGHGTLIDEQGSTYIGEFQKGVRYGYGVLDDSNTGEKYMVSFAKDH